MKRDVSHNSFLQYPGFHGRMDGYVWPRIWVELEQHCTWEPMLNSLPVDITPREYNDTVCLFLPDDSLQISTDPKNNTRLALSNTPEVLNVIEYIERNWHRQRHPDFLKNYAMLHKQIKWEPQKNDPCICGNRTKYKHCCGRTKSN